MTLYKLTDAAGRPVHGGSGAWPLPNNGQPGEWRSVKGAIVSCENGLHLLERGDVIRWLHEGILWEAEPAPRTQSVRDVDKTVVRKARLIRKVADIDRHLLVTFAADCAERVLPLFEKHYPTDSRPRRAIEAARSGSASAAYAASDAASAAEAANAAASAAEAAAADAEAAAAADAAAYAAVYAAADADDDDAADVYAYAAAYAAASAAAWAAANAAAEREWQTERLWELIEAAA